MRLVNAPIAAWRASADGASCRGVLRDGTGQKDEKAEQEGDDHDCNSLHTQRVRIALEVSCSFRKVLAVGARRLASLQGHEQSIEDSHGGQEGSARSCQIDARCPLFRRQWGSGGSRGCVAVLGHAQTIKFRSGHRDLSRRFGRRFTSAHRLDRTPIAACPDDLSHAICD